MRKQQPSLIVGGTVVILTVAYFIFESINRKSCDTIFEQTSTRIGANVDIIKNKGELFLGRAQMQELSDGAQKVALHLKTCCVAQQSRVFSADQFQTCMSAAKEYETRVQQVTTIIKEAEKAKEQGNVQLAEQKTTQAKEVANALPSSVDRLAAAALPAATNSSSVTLASSTAIKGAEQEPNNSILQANAGELGATIAGEINPADDVDFYKFTYHDAKKRRDIIEVRLDNQSTTLQPSARVYSEDKSMLLDSIAPNAAGANLSFSFSADAGKVFYVEVTSYYGHSIGKYTLTVTPQKAYDAHEPNDDVFTASPITVGQTVEANIMDRPDVDWYRLSGVKDKSVTVRLENQSTTLQPWIRVYNADKSMNQDWHSANAEGADLEITFGAEPGKEYYVVVGSYYNHSAGKYKLLTH